MKTSIKNRLLLLPVLIVLALALHTSVQGAGETARAPGISAQPVGQTNGPIPWEQIGAKAGADYHGDGLAVMPATNSARLHCIFQRLDGEATREGLWLVSTVTNTVADRFQVKAAAIGRTEVNVATDLPTTGDVIVNGQNVSFVRPGLTEEYSVSMDGVRQDFVVMKKPAGAGELLLRLAVDGAKVAQTAYGAQLILNQSGRKIAYNRLRVTDATGKELSARMEAGTELAVVVNDAGAVYPVRIDPTFSDANWVSLNPSLPGISGIDYIVNAAVIDGSGNLIVGGSFSVAGSVAANNIAKWNGSSWSALGLGVSGAYDGGSVVYALAVSGSNVYVGGSFTNAGGSAANNIAQWNGGSWSALGLGMGGGDGYGPFVSALAVSGSTLYAGGDFTTAGEVAANYIAQWNGSSWSALGLGTSEYVSALAVSGSTLYVGGGFLTAGGVTANSIAQWNGSSWSALGLGVSGGDDGGSQVNALAVSGSTLYVGGNFTSAGVVTANYIAKWNGSVWSALGSGMDSYVNALAVDSSGNLYAGGIFFTEGAVAGQYIAKWNGSAWSALGSGTDGNVNTLAMSGSTLYAGGNFTSAGGVAADNFAKWNGSVWSGFGSGMNDQVKALAVDSSGNLYAGGYFLTAGGVVVNHIAKWNGSSWSALGSGINYSSDIYETATVNALTVDKAGNVFAAGDFDTAGGVTAYSIAKWNGTNWSALGNNTVYAFATVNALTMDKAGNLYAGGYFDTAGGVAATNIAEWNGTNWSSLGLGINSVVFALAVDKSGNLYAGGSFSTAGGVAAICIAKWNGSAWSALGSGMNAQVNALAADYLGNVYAGGNFTTAGGMAANAIAKWNGTNWSALGLGIYPTLSALAVDSSGNVYAGGALFSTAGGAVANHIAKWNGSAWSTLGSGMDSYVYALALDSAGNIYAGGNFTIAGTNISPFIAEALFSIPPPPFLIVTTNGNFGFANQQFRFTLTGPAGSNAVISASTNLQNWIPLATNPLGSGSLIFTDALATNYPIRFYRATLQP